MEDPHRRNILEIMEEEDFLPGCSSVDGNHQHCNELKIDIDEEIKKPKSKCRIYRVPKHIRELNPEVYTPRAVSIGPLHHGKPELEPMERHKEIYAKGFQKRIGLEKWKSLETCVKEDKETILNCYEDTMELTSHEFEEMILLDAVFIIEFLLRYHDGGDSDVLQQKEAQKVVIINDLRLLENQLPYFLLEKLYEKAGLEPNSFITLVLETDFLHYGLHYGFNSSIFDLQLSDIKNFIDLQRCVLLNCDELKGKRKGYYRNLPSATKLHESRLKFKPLPSKSTLSDIKFKKEKRLIPLFKVDKLHMPVLQIQDSSKYTIYNVMALEQCQYPDNTYFCNFIHLLDNLIDTKEDVEVLVEKRIIVSRLGDHNETAEMINKSLKNICCSESCFLDIAEDLRKHYQNRWNRTLATLKNVYFSNPWRGTSTVVAGLLVLLTLIGTIFSILQVVLKK